MINETINFSFLSEQIIEKILPKRWWKIDILITNGDKNSTARSSYFSIQNRIKNWIIWLGVVNQ